MKNKKKVKKYLDEPAFQINKDIESVFKKNYEKTLKKALLEISLELLKGGQNNLKNYTNDKQSVEELNSMYSVLSRGNGAGSANEQLKDIEEILNERISDFNSKNKDKKNNK